MCWLQSCNAPPGLLELELGLGFLHAFGHPLEGFLQRLEPAHATPVKAQTRTIQKLWSGKPSRPY